MTRSKHPPVNYDLFDGRDPAPAKGLPLLDNLYQMYDIYNREYFGDRLPRVKISYSRRMLAAGGWFPQEREIKISEKYHALFPDEVYDTLKHEMLHIIHPRHDRPFQRAARRVGASLRATEHPALRRPPNYIYICPSCRAEYPRRKRLRMASCGKCSKGLYDERFKLVLRKSLKKRQSA